MGEGRGPMGRSAVWGPFLGAAGALVLALWSAGVPVRPGGWAAYLRLRLAEPLPLERTLAALLFLGLALACGLWGLEGALRRRIRALPGPDGVWVEAFDRRAFLPRGWVTGLEEPGARVRRPWFGVYPAGLDWVVWLLWEGRIVPLEEEAREALEAALLKGLREDDEG